jgi:hypothetical protein
MSLRSQSRTCYPFRLALFNHPPSMFELLLSTRLFAAPVSKVLPKALSKLVSFHACDFVSLLLKRPNPLQAGASIPTETGASTGV